jgi:3'(2'), 5'-bisphosphate nucleotidase
MMAPRLDRLQRTVDIALEAGREVMRHYGNCSDVEYKSEGSPLTVADRAAHGLITQELAACAPDIPCISEETAIPPFDERSGWKEFWLVDPLDGTKEFLSGNGEFTINIALIAGGCPVLGVVAAPALDVVYFGGRDRGVWRRRGSGAAERIFAGPPPPTHTRVVESRSHPTAELEAFVATLGPVERVPLGSSLKFCRIAEGSADLYPRFGRTMEWDVAAGDCLYRHATEDGSVRPSPLHYNQATLSTPRFVIGDRSCCATPMQQA